jgi:hypothetical protein
MGNVAEYSSHILLLIRYKPRACSLVSVRLRCHAKSEKVAPPRPAIQHPTEQPLWVRDARSTKWAACPQHLRSRRTMALGSKWQANPAMPLFQALGQIDTVMIGLLFGFHSDFIGEQMVGQLWEAQSCKNH